MKNLKLVFILFTTLSILSCSSEDDANNIGSLVGTYNLIAIESDAALDPGANGDFNDTEILDNISCTSAMTLSTDGQISWDYLNLSQTVDADSGVYSEIECQKINGGSGQYEIEFDGFNFIFDSALGVKNTFLNGSFITIKRDANLVVNNGGQVQLATVELSFRFEEQ